MASIFKTVPRTGGDSQEQPASSSDVRHPDPRVHCDLSSFYGTLLSADETSPLETLPPGSALVGRFEDHGEVARGGMGAIHQVFDTVLCRVLAMKRMKQAAVDSDEVASRFVEEAQITSQLDHPNIVPVHDLGLDSEQGSAFFTMKLVHGRTLTEVLRDAHEEPLSGRTLQRILEIFLKVCDAVGFAHSRGVVHRDLKPDNIMVGSHGQVYVMDWGVALLLQGQRASLEPNADRPGGPGAVGERLLPDSEYLGKIAGTAAYMAPEQAWGQVEDTDERTDVYGLGGILYEVLTGRAPHFSESSDEALALARNGEVAPPARFSVWSELPPGLCRIAMKALERDRLQRFQSVDELRSEVEQFLMGGGWFRSLRFRPGEVIVNEGDTADTAFIIISGECEAFKTINGERVVLRRMSAGDVFGETAVLTAQRRTASVRALGAVEVSVVTREALENELQRNPWLQAFMTALAERFRDVDAQLTELSMSAGSPR